MDTAVVNRRLARIVLGLALGNAPESLRASSGRYLDGAAEQDADAEAFYVYVYGVVTGWYLLALVAGLLMVGLAYAGNVIGGHTGRAVGVVVGFGITCFCIAGAADATWRSLVVYAAKRRHKRLGVADERVQAELRIARIEYPVLALQAATGAAAAVLAATLL